MPSGEDHRGNLAAGARGVGRPLNERDRWLARPDRAGAGRAGHDVRRPGRDRRLRHRDQRHEPHRHPRARQAVRHRHRRPAAWRRSSGASTPRSAGALSMARWALIARRALTLREGRPPAWDRLLAMVFFAALLHGLVILGITFNARAGDPGGAPGLKVLLVSDELPEAAANASATYLAQRTQLGSGSTRESRRAAQPADGAAGTAACRLRARRLARATRRHEGRRYRARAHHHRLGHRRALSRRLGCRRLAARPAAAHRSAAGRAAGSGGGAGARGAHRTQARRAVGHGRHPRRLARALPRCLAAQGRAHRHAQLPGRRPHRPRGHEPGARGRASTPTVHSTGP